MSKGKIIVVGSSADKFEVRDGKTLDAGYYLGELTVPVRAAIDAGYDFVLVTPKATVPVIEPRSLGAEEFQNSEEAFQSALDFANTDPRMTNPRTIRSVIDEGLENYVGVFIPGGHPPMIDLMQDSDLGTILRHFHAEGKPTGMLCHGPAAAAAAINDAKGFRAALVAGDIAKAKELAKGWAYAGYNMTAFSNEAESFVEDNVTHGYLYFYMNDMLETAGAKVSTVGDMWGSKVVEDRELITGENPASAYELAPIFVKALDRYTAKAKALEAA